MMLHFYNHDGRCCILTFNFHSTFWNTYSCSFLILSIIYIKFIFIHKKYWKLGFFSVWTFSDWLLLYVTFIWEPFQLTSKRMQNPSHCALLCRYSVRFLSKWLPFLSVNMKYWCKGILCLFFLICSLYIKENEKKDIPAWKANSQFWNKRKTQRYHAG